MLISRSQHPRLFHIPNRTSQTKLASVYPDMFNPPRSPSNTGSLTFTFIRRKRGLTTICAVCPHLTRRANASTTRARPYDRHSKEQADKSAPVSNASSATPSVPPDSKSGASSPRCPWTKDRRSTSAAISGPHRSPSRRWPNRLYIDKQTMSQYSLRFCRPAVYFERRIQAFTYSDRKTPKGPASAPDIRQVH